METKGNQSTSGSKHATNQISRIGKDSVDSVGRSAEATLDAPYPVTKPSRKKQKTDASKVRWHTFHISSFNRLHFITHHSYILRHAESFLHHRLYWLKVIVILI